MKKGKANLLIIINCSLACMFLLISGSLAAYTSLSNAKRTISTVGSRQLFSSNILMEYEKEADIQRKSMSFSIDGNSTFKVSVCNYAQENPEKYASEDITYNINISLLAQDGTTVTNQTVLSAYKLDDEPFSGLTSQTDTTLKGNQKSEKTYSVTVPGEYMKNYRIKITAVPQKSGYKSLGRILSFSEDVASSAWSLTYLSDEQKQEAYDLGAIHIRLAGSEYAQLTLTWDSTHVQIDPWFLEDMKNNSNINVSYVSGNENSNENSLTFNAGGETGTNQYNITFYRTNPVHADDSSKETWENIQSYIHLTSKKLTESNTKGKK